MASGDSTVGICNIGLIEIGEDPIASLDDNRKAAILCKSRYDQVRRDLLRAHTWNFARKRAQIANATTAPAFGFSTAFGLPNDFIRMVNLPDSDMAEYQVEGRQLLTNESAPLNVVYIYDCQDPTLFDPLFVTTLGFAMGEALAWPITQSRDVEAKMRSKKEAQIPTARLVGSQENSAEEWDEDVWLRSRL